MRRKVLVIEDEPSIRNVVYLLLGALECDGEVAHSGRQALAMIRREAFDAVLLDLRASDAPQVAHKICEVQPSLMGRILFITGHVSDPETIDLIEKNSTKCVRRARLMHDLWDRLSDLMGPARPARQSSQAH